MLIKRESYLDTIRPYYDVDLIKVITGIRRCGKSIILQTIRDEIIQNGINGDHVIYINLEDIDFEYIKTATDLNKEVKSRIVDDKKYYIFLDEIQYVKNFEKSFVFRNERVFREK